MRDQNAVLERPVVAADDKPEEPGPVLGRPVEDRTFEAVEMMAGVAAGVGLGAVIAGPIGGALGGVVGAAVGLAAGEAVERAAGPAATTTDAEEG